MWLPPKSDQADLTHGDGHKAGTTCFALQGVGEDAGGRVRHLWDGDRCDNDFTLVKKLFDGRVDELQKPFESRARRVPKDFNVCASLKALLPQTLQWHHWSAYNGYTTTSLGDRQIFSRRGQSTTANTSLQAIDKSWSKTENTEFVDFDVPNVFVSIKVLAMKECGRNVKRSWSTFQNCIVSRFSSLLNVQVCSWILSLSHVPWLQKSSIDLKIHLSISACRCWSIEH